MRVSSGHTVNQEVGGARKWTSGLFPACSKCCSPWLQFKCISCVLNIIFYLGRLKEAYLSLVQYRLWSLVLYSQKSLNMRASRNEFLQIASPSKCPWVVYCFTHAPGFKWHRGGTALLLKKEASFISGQF